MDEEEEEEGTSNDEFDREVNESSFSQVISYVTSWSWESHLDSVAAIYSWTNENFTKISSSISSSSSITQKSILNIR